MGLSLTILVHVWSTELKQGCYYGNILQMVITIWVRSAEVVISQVAEFPDPRMVDLFFARSMRMYAHIYIYIYIYIDREVAKLSTYSYKMFCPGLSILCVVTKSSKLQDAGGRALTFFIIVTLLFILHILHDLTNPRMPE